jgi:FdhD protein
MHAAAIASPDGEILAVREDVGRHNATDKVIGWAAREGRLPLTGHVLVVSARASFELVQKAVMAGLPMLVAVSAPTSLAVELAADQGLTLVAFTRAPRCTVYTRPDRLT